MSIVAPKGRKHLAAEARFRLGRNGFDPIADPRAGAAEIAFPDALMAACAMFALTAPSLLACDQERAEGHVGTIDGIERVPCDPWRRELLDPMSPEALRPLCQSVLRQLQRGKALGPLECLDGHSVLARDGPGYVASQTMHWASCLRQGHRNGSVTSSHQT